MQMLVGVVVVVTASLLSGCAGGRQELARLRSQVGLLDQRITQLERAQQAEGWAAPMATEPAVEPATAVPAARPDTSTAAQVPSSKSSLKPSTREIQQALKNAGFYQGEVDGKMGPLTREAITEFQRVHGLTDDGVVGRKTWSKLSAYTDLSAAGDEAVAGEGFVK